MALMKDKGLFELLEEHGCMLLDTKFQVDNSVYGRKRLQPASQATHIAIMTMLEELAPNLWEDDLNRLVDFGHLISPALEMVIDLMANIVRHTYCTYVYRMHSILCESMTLPDYMGFIGFLHVHSFLVI